MAIKVLIVLDGGYRFKEPAASRQFQDFTYITLVDTLRGASMEVTRAHRDNIGATAVADDKVDIQDFNFASSADLLEYDVIWLIGFHGRNGPPGSTLSSGAHRLNPDELGAISRFMDAGGGVFATGDHDSIGADMCGRIPRIRVMRAWFGEGDGDSPMPADFPRNFPRITVERADTTQKNPLGDYDLNDDGTDENHVYFENQSDSIAQPITPTTTPAHPILRRDGMDITVYPDHMHEGRALGHGDGAFDLRDPFYTHTLPDGVGPSFVEFPVVDGEREKPWIIAEGQALEYKQHDGETGNELDPDVARAKTVNTLSAYDGRRVGVGRVVTGSTFHHYIDINLTGDSDIISVEQLDRTGEDAAKGQGFNYPGAEETFANIKAVFVNITKWLARFPPKIDLILERSTFSQDEVVAGSTFEGAILVTVDGLKPNQFPGGPIDTLSPTGIDLESWAPVVLTDAEGIEIKPIGVDSDEPSLPDRIQRITFTYRLRFLNENAFAFTDEFRNFRVNASLSSAAVAAPMVDSAWIQLVKSANPFMLDLDGGNSTSWLSSDVRVLPVVAGRTVFGVELPVNASKAQAYNFIQTLMGSISVSQFESLSMTQADSALSPFPTTTGTGEKVYNFAIARVRLNGESAMANQVRVFFRIFTSQTTAALTYRNPSGGEPLEGYRKTSGGHPIAIPGITSGGDAWMSFPFFSENRVATPEMQTDGNNVQNISPAPGSEVSTFFGALIDNNLPDDTYLRPTPLSEAVPVSISTLLMGEHQCLVAQIEFAGTPIPDGANPSTSDKLSQRNLAISAIANPGIDASRMALHTFEIEATPAPITATLLPDELMLEWAGNVPEGTEVSIYIPTWNTDRIIELADNIYPRHDIVANDAQTVILPGGGTSYVPIPRSFQRQTGVITATFPLGITKGQRFDLVVRQISNRSRKVNIPPGKSTYLSQEDAQRLIDQLDNRPTLLTESAEPPSRRAAGGRGAFNLGDNRILYTDLSIFNEASDRAILYELPDPELVAAARREEGTWRETIGSFQLGIPVSIKEDMLLYYMRLLSVFRWRLEMLQRRSRWYRTLVYYVELLARKVQALGGDPYTIPATPGGDIGQLPTGEDDKTSSGEGADPGNVNDRSDPFFEPADDDWLSDTTDLGNLEQTKPLVLSGKVSGLLFDHFGDFEGFTLETYAGRHFRLFSREEAILNIAKEAWIERYVVTAITVSRSSKRVRRLLIRGYAHHQ